MSSDPIEVLRELEAKLNRLEDKYREAIKGRDAADPLTNHRLGLAEGFGVAAMCVRDALASLSAPKGDLTVKELVEMLGGIVYWSGLDEASIGKHGDANVTSELEAAVAMLNARMAPNPESAEAVPEGVYHRLRSIRYNATHGSQDRPLHMRLRLIAEDAQRAIDAYESAPPRPESAEAVFNCPTCPVSVQSRWQEPECPECGERCYLDPTAAPAPPRPEASAPIPGTTLRFGMGEFIVNTGTAAGGEPAVFVDAAPEAGEVGGKAPDVPAGTTPLLRMLFSTREQAQAVCAALVKPPSAPVGVEGWRPIDTVPRDRTPVVVWMPKGYPSSASYGPGSEPQATHWLPLRGPHDLAQQPAACDMGELCIGCEPRNADGSCPGQQPAAVDEAIRAAVEAEREACAKACDDRSAYYHAGDDDGPNTRRGMACAACASVIRWRSTVSASFLAKHEASIEERLAGQQHGGES